MSDNFSGDDAHLCACIDALLDLDAKGVLVPHGIGGHARTMLVAAASRLRAAQLAAPAAPTNQQIVDTLARHGIGWLGFSDDQSVTAYPLDGEDAPVYIAAVRELLGQPAQGERKPDDAARYKVVLKKEYADYQQKAQALELTILPFDIYVRQYNGIIDAEIRFLA